MLAGSLSLLRGQMPSGAADYRKGDYAAALPQLSPQAESGDPVAQFLVAQSYEMGRGVQRDNPTAQSWYQRARRAELPRQLRQPAEQSAISSKVGARSIRPTRSDTVLGRPAAEPANCQNSLRLNIQY